MVNENQDNQIVQTFFFRRSQRGYAKIGNLRDDFIDFIQQIIGVVDIASFDFIQQVVYHFNNLRVGDGHISDQTGCTGRRKLNPAVSIADIDAADTGTQFQLHTAFQTVLHHAENHAVNIQIRRHFRDKFPNSLFADLLQDGNQHTVCHVVQHGFRIELVHGISGKVLDDFSVEDNGFDTFAADGKGLTSTVGAVVQLFAFGKSNTAYRGTPGRERTGLHVGEVVSIDSGIFGNIIGVHMASEDIPQTGVCQGSGSFFPVFHHIFAEHFVLHIKMGNQSVVHQADDSFSFRLGFLNLIDCPNQQVFIHPSGSNVLVGFHAGGIRAVHAGIQCQNHIISKRSGIREPACLFSLRRGVIFRVKFSVITEVCVNFLEFSRSNRFGVFLFAVFKSTGVEIIVNIVVAVNDENFRVGLVFNLLHFCGKFLMAFFLAVLGEVAGNQHDVWLVFFNHLYSGIQHRTGFCQHLGVTVDIGLIIFTVGNIGQRIVMCIRDYADFQCVLCCQYWNLWQKSDHDGQRQTDAQCFLKEFLLHMNPSTSPFLVCSGGVGRTGQSELRSSENSLYHSV